MTKPEIQTNEQLELLSYDSEEMLMKVHKDNWPVMSFRDKLTQNNPHLVCSAFSNPIWVDSDDDVTCEDKKNEIDVE